MIAGLIALGAGGYAAWVDPNLADRIPQDVKASIKRRLPSDQPPAQTPAQKAEPAASGSTPSYPAETRVVLPKETPVVLPSETPVLLPETPIPMVGGLMPPSEEEVEAQRKHAEAANPPDAGLTGEPIGPSGKSPAELAAAGSPVPTMAPGGLRGNSGVGRKFPSGRGSGPDVRAGVVAPYPQGDATMRALRLLNQQKKRRESGWTPESEPRPRLETPPAPPRAKVVNPAGAPILE